MKRFSLDEYLKNPSIKVATRDGREVKIHCTNYRTKQPIIAEIEGKNCSESFTKDGKWLSYEDSENDLFFATKKHEGWINMYKTNCVGTEVFNTPDSAKEYGMRHVNYVATIKIEWEE